MSARVTPARLERALGEMAGAGIVAADARWVAAAIERGRVSRHLPPPARRRIRARRSASARVDRAALADLLTVRDRRPEPPPLRLMLSPPPSTPEPAGAGAVLGAAGLPRTLLVPDPTLAMLLRAHALHLETGAPVLALPRGPLPAWVREGIERAADAARVLVVHDCDPYAIAALAGVRVRLGLPAAARLVAVGLRPAQARRLGLPAARGRTPADDAVATASRVLRLTDAEVRWLAEGRRAEVAAVAPDRLLRSLRRLLLGIDRRPAPRVLPDPEAAFV